MCVVVIDTTLGLPAGIPKVHIVTLSNLVPCLLLDIFVKISNATEQKRLKSFVFYGCGLDFVVSFVEFSDCFHCSKFSPGNLTRK